MRGKPQAQPDFLTGINLNQCVPAEHPLRASKSQVDAVLKKLSPLFDELYAEDGRASIPPEQLLKARVLTALYSVRSERLFCEQLGYNLLWRWFLDREFSEGSFDHSIFAKNHARVLSADVAKLFFLEVSFAGSSGATTRTRARPIPTAGCIGKPAGRKPGGVSVPTP